MLPKWLIHPTFYGCFRSVIICNVGGCHEQRGELDGPWLAATSWRPLGTHTLCPPPHPPQGQIKNFNQNALQCYTFCYYKFMIMKFNSAFFYKFNFYRRIWRPCLTWRYRGGHLWPQFAYTYGQPPSDTVTSSSVSPRLRRTSWYVLLQAWRHHGASKRRQLF